MNPLRPICVLLTTAGLAAAAPAGASAATIDFDALSPGTTANAQFSAQGVSFNGSTVYDYGTGFAHSGTHALENCRAVEFCGAPPVRADFTSAQTKVGVWVGSHADPGQPSRVVRLTALDAGGATVGSQQVTLPAGAAVSRHLEVTAATATIRALEVKPADGADSYDMVVDDVEFTTAGPPPPCPATGPPVVELTSPANGTTLQHDQLRLTGSVDGRGAPVTEATVVSDGSTRRTAHFSPTPSARRAARSRSTWAACCSAAARRSTSPRPLARGRASPPTRSSTTSPCRPAPASSSSRRSRWSSRCSRRTTRCRSSRAGRTRPSGRSRGCSSAPRGSPRRSPASPGG